jgi:coenzyme PQQ precursor peptide PqqA
VGKDFAIRLSSAGRPWSDDLACTILTATGAQTYRPSQGGSIMAWTTPTLVEICVGLEINGYLPAEF